MTLYETIFYILAILILGTTTLAVTRRNLVHAVIYLVFSFFGTAMLFYLFGAPLLAALEVIIYAGAIMVLFLFIIMMLRVDSRAIAPLFPWRQWLPAALIALIYLAVGGVLVFTASDSATMLTAALAEPQVFGAYIFKRHWLSIEIVSLLLLVAAIGAVHLGARVEADDAGHEERTE